MDFYGNLEFLSHSVKIPMKPLTIFEISDKRVLQLLIPNSIIFIKINTLVLERPLICYKVLKKDALIYEHQVSTYITTRNNARVQLRNFHEFIWYILTMHSSTNDVFISNHISNPLMKKWMHFSSTQNNNKEKRDSLEKYNCAYFAVSPTLKTKSLHHIVTFF